MTTRQLPGFSILLTQYALCKFILISTELLTLLSPFSSSASGLLLHNRASDFGEEVGIFSGTPPLHTSYAIKPFFLVFSYHSFLFAGRNRTFYSSQARTTRTYPRRNKIIPSIFGYLLPGTSIPYFFPLSPFS